MNDPPRPDRKSSQWNPVSWGMRTASDEGETVESSPFLDTKPPKKSSRLVRYLKVGVLVGIGASIVVYIVSLLPVFAFLWAFGSATSEGQRSGYTPKRNMVVTEEAYQINLREHYFSIPKVYMQRYGTRTNGIVSSIGFHALLPDWQFYTPEMGSKEAFLKHPKRISVSLELTGMTKKRAYEVWRSSYKGGAMGSSTVKIISQAPHVEVFKSLGRDQFFLLEQASVPKIMACRFPLGEILGVADPDCEIYLMYDDYLVVNVYFNRDEELVKNWLTISDMALEKLRSFEIKPEEMQKKVQEK